MTMDQFIDKLDFILNRGMLIAGIIFILVIIGGLIYRIVKKKPYRGNPPIGVMNDLPSSVTGINKHHE